MAASGGAITARGATVLASERVCVCSQRRRLTAPNPLNDASRPKLDLLHRSSSKENRRVSENG